MNSYQKSFFIVPAVILIFISCGSKPEMTTHQSVLKTDTCNRNENHTYFVYIPEHSAECELMPLVIIIDPHGSGGFAIQHFIEAAERYKLILGASNLVRNNFPGYVRAIGGLIDDMRDQYPVSDEIYLAGFSGGARMVLSFAQDHQVNGILACGALAERDQLEEIKTSIYAVSGWADFNFPEAANLILNESDKPSNLEIHLTGELHQWPSSEDIKQALGWLYLNNRPAGAKCISDKAVLKDFAARGKDLIDSLLKYNQYIQIKMFCKAMLEIEDLPDRRYFREILETALQHPELLEEMSQLRKSLQFEYRVREAYYHALDAKDALWWKREIDELNSRIERGDDQIMQYALKRIKAFLGIVCYSLANNALRTNDLNAAEKILAIYKLAEPENPDMFYFYALYYLKTGRDDDISTSIKNSLDYGFSDTSQIRKEFPAVFWKDILP